MTVLSVVQDASLSVGVERPTQLFANTGREALEFQSMVNECARMIAFDTGRDWTALKALATIGGNGVASSFPLPSDYKRMLKNGSLWPSTSPNSPFTHVADTDDWLGGGASYLGNAWTLIGDQIYIRYGGTTGAFPSGATVQFYYLADRPVKTAAGVPKAAFTADDDVFRLDERLLKLALVYRWKQAKGQDYAEEMADYENALVQAIGADKGSVILASGRSGRFAEAFPSYPWPLG